MLDPFDYKEPSCAVCGGKEFYNPDPNAPLGRIPVKRIIDKLDGLFNKNNLDEAGRLLEYWQKEANSLKDKEGELSILDELVGYYRKTNDKEKALWAIDNCLNLIKELNLDDTISAGTIFLNSATTLKAFGLVEKALPLYDKAESLYNKFLSPTDEKFAGFYNNKALALADVGHFDNALVCFNKALEIGSNAENGLLNNAVTYVNMAHTVKMAGHGMDKVTDCLFKAYEIINDENVIRNGYYAFVISKCAPSFEYFGYKKIADELSALAKNIYERN